MRRRDFEPTCAMLSPTWVMLLRYSLGTDLRATTLCVFLRCDARLPLGPLRRATHAHALLVPDPPALFWAPLPTSVVHALPVRAVRCVFVVVQGLLAWFASLWATPASYVCWSRPA